MAKKPKTEAEMRRDILFNAKQLGCYTEALKIFERYDKLLKNCPSELERHQIGVMGAAELHKLLECQKALVIHGQVIVPADPDYKDPE